jgi:hypothetical protein
MSTSWRVIANRKEEGKLVWTQEPRPVIVSSIGPASAGSLLVLNSEGKIDASLIPGGSYLMAQDGQSLPQRTYLNFQLSFSLVDDPETDSTDVLLSDIDMGTF